MDLPLWVCPCGSTPGPCPESTLDLPLNPPLDPSLDPPLDPPLDLLTFRRHICWSKGKKVTSTEQEDSSSTSVMRSTVPSLETTVRSSANTDPHALGSFTLRGRRSQSQHRPPRLGLLHPEGGGDHSPSTDPHALGSFTLRGEDVPQYKDLLPSQISQSPTVPAPTPKTVPGPTPKPKAPVVPNKNLAGLKCDQDNPPKVQCSPVSNVKIKFVCNYNAKLGVFKMCVRGIP